MRGLVPFEVAAVVAVVVAPWPEMLPIALPLFVAATLARMVRGRSWGELMKGNGALVGAVAGLAALGIALALGTPVVERLTERTVDWGSFPIVRGNLGQLIGILMIVTCATIAVELALRGWLVERVLELSRAPAIFAILVGAFAEVLLVDGGLTARLGGAVFGIGLGWMYVASGRNLAAPLCARLAFQLGAVVLEWLKLVG